MEFAKFSTTRIVGALLVILVVIWVSSLQYQAQHSPVLRTLNSTLGFGATILISLPERSDRRDAVSLIASTTGISISHTVSAVRGEDIAAKARPYGKAVGTLDEPHWGSWRSHLDALKYVVDNNLETALILEDDVDWEPKLKLQMKALAQTFQSSPVTGAHRRDSTKYPYGTDWDVMHLGVSRISASPNRDGRMPTAYHDPTLPQGSYQDIDCQHGGPWYCFSDFLKSLDTPGQSRVMTPSHEPIGLVALAVTLRGAQRLMYLLSWRGLDDGLDWSIRDYVKAGNLTGWTVVPPLFGSWNADKGDSDINSGVVSKPSNNLKGKSRGVRDSAREHLGDLMLDENAERTRLVT